MALWVALSRSVNKNGRRYWAELPCRIIFTVFSVVHHPIESNTGSRDNPGMCLSFAVHVLSACGVVAENKHVEWVLRRGASSCLQVHPRPIRAGGDGVLKRSVPIHRMVVGAVCWTLSGMWWREPPPLMCSSQVPVTLSRGWLRALQNHDSVWISSPVWEQLYTAVSWVPDVMDYNQSCMKRLHFQAWCWTGDWKATTVNTASVYLVLKCFHNSEILILHDGHIMNSVCNIIIIKKSFIRIVSIPVKPVGIRNSQENPASPHTHI